MLAMNHINPFMNGSMYRSVLIPEMNFTCNGTIMSVKVVGKINRTKDSYPMLQIWRKKEHGRRIYYKVGNSDIVLNQLQPEGKMSDRNQLAGAGNNGHNPNELGKFVCHLSMNQYVSVKSGDILGLRLPPSNMSGFEIFTRSSPTLKSYVYVGPNRDPLCIDLSDVSSMIVQHVQPQIKLQGIHVKY